MSCPYSVSYTQLDVYKRQLLVDVGQSVRKGELLLQLDHRSLDADLAQADAALREAEAGAALARSQLARGELLVKDKYISATQVDELRAGRVQGLSLIHI